jgi:hypothetical protein
VTNALPGEPVVVAKGSAEGELRRVARLLHAAGIHFEVEEGIGGSPEHPQWQWQVIVLADSLDAARRALSAEPARPTSAEPAPGPLFEPRGQELFRVALALAALGLAGGLWLRTCVS